MTLRLVFMGTPDFAVPTLVELIGQGHEIAAVYTRAPRPAGRGMAPTPTPVAREAMRQIKTGRIDQGGKKRTSK